MEQYAYSVIAGMIVNNCIEYNSLQCCLTKKYSKCIQLILINSGVNLITYIINFLKVITIYLMSLQLQHKSFVK
jgi:hypothetical protein